MLYLCSNLGEGRAKPSDWTLTLDYTSFYSQLGALLLQCTASREWCDIYFSLYQFLFLRTAAEVAKACTVQSHMQGMQGNKSVESTENVRELFPAVVNH